MANHPGSHNRKPTKKKAPRVITKQMRKVLTPYTIARLEEEGLITSKTGNIRDIAELKRRRNKKLAKLLKQ